jgi:hemolysin III
MKPPKITQPVPAPLPFQTPGEEIANSILHGLGIVLAAAGLVFLILRATGRLGGIAAGPLAVTCYAVYSATMIAMFFASTLYHAIQQEGLKRVLRIIDHSTVYILIAGSYTAFGLLGLRGVLGWVYFGAEWALAAAGAILYAIDWKFLKKAELAVYILMGWAIAASFPRLWRQIPTISFILLVSGGLVYTAGTFWYRRRHRRISHVIWHCHVVAGAVCHWLSLWFMS